MNPPDLRDKHTAIIRDLALADDATDVALAAELGRLELEFRLALLHDNCPQLHTGHQLLASAFELLSGGALHAARATLEDARALLARFGDRPTEPPSLPSPSPSP